MKILIIEDQENIAKLIKEGLKREGYAADYLTSGNAGQRRIELHSEDYDLIVLDLLLPDKNGLDICREVRKLGITNPILILTAKDDVENVVNLLEAGADDYMTKPFELRELVARIKAIARRPHVKLSQELCVADLVLNTSTRRVFRSGKEISLTLKEFRILEYLMLHKDQAVKREDIMSNLWDFDFDSFSNVLDVFVSKLRKKVDNDHPQKIIKSVRGIGYKLVNIG